MIFNTEISLVHSFKCQVNDIRAYFHNGSFYTQCLHTYTYGDNDIIR